MNKLRQEFSSRSKSFNSNSKEGHDKNKNRGKNWKKKSVSLHHGEDSPPKKPPKKSHVEAMKSISHAANGFAPAKEQPAQKRKLTKVANGKSFEKTSKSPKDSQQIKEKNIFNSNKNNAKKVIQKPELQDRFFTSSKESIIKRKKQQNTTTSKKFKKEHSPLVESDSDAEDYIDKFFDDVSDDEQVDSQLSSTSVEPDEVSSEDDTSTDDSDSSGQDDGNAMSFEELMQFYGSFRDKQAQSSRGSLKTTTKNKSRPKNKTEKITNKASTVNPNQWIVEDNEEGLVYEDSDEEPDSLQQSKALVKVTGNACLESSDDDDFLPDDSGDEEEDLTSEDEMLSFEMEDDSETTEGSSNQDGVFYSSDGFDSEEDESNFSYEEEYDELSSYWGESYDSEDDDDYVPSEDEDDLYIGRGKARVYEIDDNNISFNSDIDSAQIIELPSDEKRKRSLGTSTAESQSDEEKEDEDSELCPDLVPIYDDSGRLIEDVEMPEQYDSMKVLSSGKSSQINVTDPLHKKIKLDRNDNSLEDNYGDIADSLSQPESDPRLDVSKLSNYQFYDSINLRMSLLVLKSTLYFSGHLTIQPLIGGLEIMGYSLKPGECKTAFAARGFHCLNLTPLPSDKDNRKKTMCDVLQRLEKHFLDADLKFMSENFNPLDSVLVLLQSDCNNRRVEVIDKYMPEETLFPKVEFLQKGVFFTTEHLLNAEFLTEHVEKCTRLYKSDPEWDKIRLEQSSRIIVIGGKGAGKSTLCQYLVNQAIGKFKKAVLIDLDIGQPIQHIPETISVTIVDKPLLGVACFDPIAPKKCWLFGSLDVVSSPIFYIQNIRKLVQYCHEHRAEFSNVPWIINTMGYASGFGDELMAAIIRMIAPSDVVQLVSTKKSLSIPNFQNTFTSDVVNQYNFNILRTEMQEFCQNKASFRHCQLNVNHARLGFSLNAPKRRNLMLFAHLATILNDCSSEWFNEVRPFSAPLDRLQVLITREDQSLAEQQLPAVLNATLVYLCRKADTGSLYECLGIGIVRGVDKNNNVFLLQSLPVEQLAEITVLAICSSSLPNAIFLRQSTRIQGSIPYVFNVGCVCSTDE